MFKFECKDCKYEFPDSAKLGAIFEFCTNCRKRRTGYKQPNKQYDEFYKDCTTHMPEIPCMVSLSNSGIYPPHLDEYTGFDKSKIYAGRSDIPTPSFFDENIKHLKGYVLQPKEVKHMLDALKSPEYAIASWEFNQTFETQYCQTSAVCPVFKEEYDMKVVDEIIKLAEKIKKVTRVK